GTWATSPSSPTRGLPAGPNTLVTAVDSWLSPASPLIRDQEPGYAEVPGSGPASGDLVRRGSSKQRRSMSRLIMLPCAAYLRVYEPLSAFGPAERRRWQAYATTAVRPRRADALQAEHAEALRRIIALPPIVAPAKESPHAYVRWTDGITYVCPWQTRLRSWLALGRLQATAGPLLAGAFAPEQHMVGAAPVVRAVRADRALARAQLAGQAGQQGPGDRVSYPHAYLRDCHGPGAQAGGPRAGRRPARVRPETGPPCRWHRCPY